MTGYGGLILSYLVVSWACIHLVMFVQYQSVFGCYCECLVVVECNFVCVVVCLWWHEVGDMVGVSGGPLYHIWLYLCVFGWVCLVVCWWWRGARNMIDCIWPFGCIWV